MTYKINTENSGLDTDQQASRMADLAIERGYDVAFTAESGDVQGYDDNGECITCPIPNQEWMQLVEIAAALTPTTCG